MNPPLLQPYLFFGGRCEEALQFYRAALQADVELMLRFKESPDPPPPGAVPPGYEDKIMHASVRIGQTVFMASDGCGDSPGFAGFSLSLTVATAAEADRVFNALSAGGSVTMPLAKTFWSPRFGMLTDRFGLGWMISAAA